MLIFFRSVSLIAYWDDYKLKGNSNIGTETDLKEHRNHDLLCLNRLTLDAKSKFIMRSYYFILFKRKKKTLPLRNR